MAAQTETKWTPGPWRVEATKGLPVMIRGNVPAGKPSAVAQIMRDHAWESDAHLIAAAPAFAGAARDAKAAGFQHTPGCPTGECWCYRLGAALAKAEGR